MKKILCMIMFAMALFLSFGCSQKEVYAQTYYGSVEEMQQNADWWGGYTLGTKQKVTMT